MIKIRNLTKVYETINYNVVALSNLNFDFEKGEVVVLLGRSGSGKSTFLNILGGFDNTYSGSYYFDNNEFKKMSQSEIDELRSKKIGFIFQHQVLFNQLTVIENVELSLDVLGVDNSKKKRLNAMKALTLVGLRRHAYKKPWQLSGGEKQRLAIARAIVKDPEVIICDEPTAALDSITSKEVLDLLASVCKNKLLIIATHNKSIVKNYGTRIIELKSGYVVRDELVKPDKSNVEVDEFDKLLDEELYGDESIVVEEDLLDEDLVAKVEQSEILKDLGLDLSQYKERTEEVFEIDEKEKRSVITKRKEEVTVEERFDAVDKVLSNKMVNDKKFARKSFLYYRRTYLFLMFFVVSFILVSILAFNISSNVFMKNDNTDEIIYNYFQKNHLLQLNPVNKIGLFLDDKGNIDYRQQFIEKTNIDPFSKKEYNYIVNDYSFNFRYTKDIYLEIKNYLDKKGYAKSYGLYYDPHNIMVEVKNDDIIFENLQAVYYVINSENGLQLKNLANKESNVGVTPLYVDNYETILKPYLIGDSKFPNAQDEVLLSVETIINNNILNIKNKANINDVYAKFNSLKDKTITISVPKVIIDKEEIIFDEEIKTFKIVGLINAGEKINNHYTYENNITMFFSRKATNALNIQIENRTDFPSFPIPLYMEIDKDLYSNIKDEIETIKTKYLEKEYEKINETLKIYYKPLEKALKEYNNQISFVDETLYPGLTYVNLYNKYLTNYQELSKDTFIPSEINLGLAYERTINEVFVEYYWPYTNNKNYFEIEEVSEYGAFILNNNLKAGNYHNIYLLIEELFTNFSENVEDLYKIELSNTNLKTLVIFARVIVNPEFLVTVINAIVSTLLVIIFLYVFEWILSRLFLKIYQLFLNNRLGEFGSMRILGAKFDYIKRIMKLEGNALIYSSYVIVLSILGIIKLVTTFYKGSLVIYLYQPFNKTFLNIRLIDFFSFSIFSIISIFILMQIVFKKQLIDESIDKNLKDMNMLHSAANWDGE